MINKEEIFFRKATIEDTDSIFLANKKLIDDYENISQIDYEKVLDWVHKKIQTKIDEYTVLMYRDDIVGFFRLNVQPDVNELDDLYLFEKYRNQGLGTHLIQRCIEQSDKNLILYVFIKNQAAIKLYQRLGFKIVQNIKNSRYIMEYQK